MADVYGRVAKPFWDDRPVAVIGGGPSVKDIDFDMLRGAHVLAVKNTIFDVPWADAGFAHGNYEEMRDKLADVPARVYWALYADQRHPAPLKNVTFLKRQYGVGMSDDPGVIYGGATSGFAAMQICIHKRAKSIVLFGFDYDRATSTTTDTRGFKRVANWREWAEHFRVYVPHLTKHGISVANACPSSAISCFQKVSLQDGIEMVRRK